MICESSCSRYDVAIEFVRLLGLKNEICIEIVGSDYFRDKYFEELERIPGRLC